MEQTSKIYVYSTYIFITLSAVLLFLLISRSCPNESNSSNEVYPNTNTQALANCFNFSASKLVCHSDSIGNYICQGELTNNCDTPYQFVKLTGSYYKNGTFIGTSDTYVTTSGMNARGTMPFTIYTTENSMIFDSYKLQVEAS